MFHARPGRKSIRELLREKSGTSIADGIASSALVIIILGAFGVAVSTNTAAITTIATKAERSSLVASLVGDKHSLTGWGTPEDPNTEMVSLPNGHEVEVTTWREDTATSTRFTAVSPISSDPDAEDCTGPMDIAKRGCLYSTRLHADDLESLQPDAIIRMTPSISGADAVGTVDERVGSETFIPQGTPFAAGSDRKAAVWRYLVDARSAESNGEIRIAQGGKTLAVFPITTESHNYYGTFTAAANSPITVSVTSGNAIVKTVLIYRAGSTS